VVRAAKLAGPTAVLRMGTIASPTAVLRMGNCRCPRELHHEMRQFPCITW